MDGRRAPRAAPRRAALLPASYKAGPPCRGLPEHAILFSFLLPQIGRDLPPIGIALVIALLVVSLGIHEAAHGWVALKCGDPTARDLGRITLNPLPHIDPFMTILLPAIGWMSGGFIFGGAKPVPVNYYNLRSPRRDMAFVAIAGPASNFVLAAFFALCLKVLVLDTGVWQRDALGARVLANTITINLALAAFNLLPIPPLDGSRVMTWLLPGGLRESYDRLERFGLFLVVALVILVPAVGNAVRDTIYLMAGWIDAVIPFGDALPPPRY